MWMARRWKSIQDCAIQVSQMDLCSLTDANNGDK